MEIYKDKILDNLLDASAIKQKLTLKQSDFDHEVIRKVLLEEYKDKGWEIEKENKNSYRVKKRKSFDRAFEDRVWSLLARMGFKYMNTDRNFRVRYSDNNSIPGKQIDIFAIDEETMLFIECKASMEKKIGSFQKDLHEIGNIRSGVLNTISKLFDGKFKKGWIFFTNNIIVNENDKSRLQENNIVHLNQDDLEYYEKLVNLLGTSAKYQLYARLFKKQDIPLLNNKVPAIKGMMGGYTYYSFSIEPTTLLKICYVLHRENINEDSLSTYQRMIKKKRIKEIENFLENGGFFPNAIIINIDSSESLQFDLSSATEYISTSRLGVLHLPKKYKSAFIIDGQHRVYGYSNVKYKDTNTIPVVAFENLPSEKQSTLFVEINHEQKSVPKNLLLSLDAELKWNSPNHDDAMVALKSKLGQMLNEKEDSPLYKRINTGENKLSTSTVTLKYITDYGINRTKLFGEVSKKKLRDLYTS